MNKYCIACGKKLGDYRSVRCKSCANKNENHPNWKGKKKIILHCQECGQRLKTIAWGKRHPKYCSSCKQKGERSPLWKGGITPQRILEYQSQEYKDFVNAVLKRDNYTCQICGGKTKERQKIKLEVHHIKSYAENPKVRFDIKNGITLCKECHLNTLRNHKRAVRVDRNYPKKICQKCNKEFSKRNAKKFCDACKKLKCLYCNKEFLCKNADYKQKFCSRKCYSQWCSKNRVGKNHPSWQGGKKKRNCEICNKEYYVTPALLNKSRFCSKKCRNKWQSEFMKRNNPHYAYRKK